jgi:hypothetical protein
MPNWETDLWGHTISWNILFPGLILPGIMMTLMAVYPFIEAFVTGDKREHHLLDRPRDNPTRTALGAMSLVFYGLLWMNGGNDLIAYAFHIEINAVTRFTQVALIVLPPIVFMVTKRACLGLQRKDLARVLHGRETGIIKRLPSGEFIEVHEPLTAEHRFKLMVRQDYRPLEAGPETDEEGIPAPGVLRHPPEADGGGVRGVDQRPRRPRRRPPLSDDRPPGRDRDRAVQSRGVAVGVGRRVPSGVADGVGEVVAAASGAGLPVSAVGVGVGVARIAGAVADDSSGVRVSVSGTSSGCGNALPATHSAQDRFQSP